MTARTVTASLALCAAMLGCRAVRADEVKRPVGFDLAKPTPGPTLEARLVDRDRNALRQMAIVEVSVNGFQLVDAASVGEQPQKQQGHLHYRVDDGPMIATTVKKLGFHGLSPGEHRITVMLAGNDHTPVGVSTMLSLVVPQKESWLR